MEKYELHFLGGESSHIYWNNDVYTYIPPHPHPPPQKNLFVLSITTLNR